MLPTLDASVHMYSIAVHCLMSFRAVLSPYHLDTTAPGAGTKNEVAVRDLMPQLLLSFLVDQVSVCQAFARGLLCNHW